MDVELVYSPAMAGYDLGPGHPLKPARFALAVELMEAYGLVPPGTAGDGRATRAAVARAGVGGPSGADGALRVVAPSAATDVQLLRAHDPRYVATVRSAGAQSERFFPPRAGLGGDDTPVFPRMHEAAALVAGAAVRAVDDVMGGTVTRALSVAGGLHHAHRDRAAGFCVYNDCAVGIAHALAERPDLRVLYVDIDAHHGDGVQAAFWDDPRVLTISVHETGFALYPGTGFARERGGPTARGSAANVAMPPDATDACYRLAFDEAVAPLARRFAPGLVVAQCGADAHHSDPLTSLGLTLPGYRWLVRAIVALADELCAGRLVAFGGGGYSWEHVVPRAWTALAAELAGAAPADGLPQAWRDRVRSVTGAEPPLGLSEDRFDTGGAAEARLLADTREAVADLMRET
ncbi:MAG TPA: acetoin utilization protein AcuC [Coriobacteriia bacterium]